MESHLYQHGYYLTFTKCQQCLQCSKYTEEDTVLCQRDWFSEEGFGLACSFPGSGEDAWGMGGHL